MKLKAGNKIIPLFEKKKAAPVQKPSFSGANPGFPKASQPFQKSIKPKPMMPGTKPGFPRPKPSFPGSQPMGQKPILRPGPSIYPGISSSISPKKEKPKGITQIIANLPKDELAAYVSIIVGLIFICIGILMLLA